MKKITDYIFNNSWQLTELNIKSNEEYMVVSDVGDLKNGDLVKFVGYADVDNHFGIYVFINSKKEVLEVSGDFSGAASFKSLKSALLKA